MSTAVTVVVASPESAGELQASGRIVVRVVQALAVAMASVQKDRIRPTRTRPMHRV
jgi:hypothetical protein